VSQLRLAVIFGGRSGEHEISVLSARSVMRGALEAGFDVVGVGITREGQWVYLGDGRDCLEGRMTEVLPGQGPPCAIMPDPSRRGIFVDRAGAFDKVDVDAVFPVLHGTYGEDGTIQGLLEMSGLPYVGAPPLGSAVCMDKWTTKKLLEACGVPHVPALSVERWAYRKDPQGTVSRVMRSIPLPAFVKPSASGSSLGVSKVKEPSGLEGALRSAFVYDTRALIEPSQEGALEIECSVLGNDDPKASIAGQIVPGKEFYDYEAKYMDAGSKLVIPAPLEPHLMEEVQRIAVAAFKACSCKGMARVDFFVDPVRGRALVSELNTIPGFTAISMYPKLWEASGLPFPALVRRLVELAMKRQADETREVRRVD